MTPKTEKGALGWYVETDWDYEGNESWSGPFSSESAALAWYWRLCGGSV